MSSLVENYVSYTSPRMYAEDSKYVMVKGKCEILQFIHSIQLHNINGTDV